MRTWIKVSAVTVAFFSLAASTAQAQSGDIQATANVLASISVVTGRDLDFGNVTPGVDKTVVLTDATSGRFDATGAASAGAQITFTLPTDLVNGGNLLPIASWTGCWNTINDATAGCAAATMGGNTNGAFSAGGLLYVFVGATVSPAPAQAVGIYSAAVTMTLSYL
jgi:hypothetical protein